MLPWELLLPGCRCLSYRRAGEQKLWVACLPIPFLTYVVVAILEALGLGQQPIAGAGEACKRASGMFGRWFAGLIGFGIFAGLAGM